MLAVEGWEAVGRAPRGTADRLRQRVDLDLGRIAELEAEQGHDVAAFVSALQETAGDDGRFLHLGITSSDVVDTALATQLRDACEVLDEDAAALEAALARQAVRHRHTLMPGRTHGVHAEPITLGVKLAAHWDEVRRSRVRLAAAGREVAVGKVTGAVGTHSTYPPQAEVIVCERLGLDVAPVATQVVARDRHAALLVAMAVFGGVLERLATTVRLLQQTEVGEVEEPFAVGQKGSSVMPHKRNPVLCERICGLARALRSHALVGLEDIALWHERDISHSSAERIVLPDACAALDYMLQLATRVVQGMRVDPEAMRRHLHHGGGLVFSSRVLDALVGDAGWPRERAYRAVQELATVARDGAGSFRDLVEASAVGEALRRAGVDLATVFDATSFLRHVDETFRRLGLPMEEAPPEEAAAAPAAPVEVGLGGGEGR